MKKIYLAGLSALFIVMTASSVSYEGNFKNYAIGIDTGYTLMSAFNSGYGAGLVGEICFLGNLSFFVDGGYQNIYTGITNSQLYYIYGGFRYYLTYDALAGPWAGLGLGIREDLLNVDTNVPYIHFILPIEMGYKYILDDASGFYLEPAAKLVLLPKIDITNGFYATWAFFIGANAGFSF